MPRPWDYLVPGDVCEDSLLLVLGESLVIVSPGAGAGEGLAGSLEDLAAADESIVAEPVLGRLGGPGIVGPPDAVPQEMWLRAKYPVEIDGYRQMAFGRGERWGRSDGRGNGGGVGGELEVGEETVGPFAGGARAELGIGGGPEKKG